MRIDQFHYWLYRCVTKLNCRNWKAWSISPEKGLVCVLRSHAGSSRRCPCRVGMWLKWTVWGRWQKPLASDISCPTCLWRLPHGESDTPVCPFNLRPGGGGVTWERHVAIDYDVERSEQCHLCTPHILTEGMLEVMMLDRMWSEVSGKSLITYYRKRI